jgi:hypothetical protein
MLAREMTTRAIREPGLRDSHEDVYALWSRAIADVIRDAQAAGEVDAQVDADLAGWRLTRSSRGWVRGSSPAWPPAASAARSSATRWRASWASKPPAYHDPGSVPTRACSPWARGD